MKPLIVLLGATASGKTALSLDLAKQFQGEILSCDSVAVYRGMELGTAKPSREERSSIPHHGLDTHNPSRPCTAGDYSRQARQALAEITARHHLPIVAGGTGFYLRALLDGLFPAPPANPGLRELLHNRAGTRGPTHLHRTLTRLDAEAAKHIHPNDIPKAIRAIEISLAARRPMTEQWAVGRDPLTGYNVLRIGLNPPRPILYRRIDQRAAAMFTLGLVEETRQLLAQYGESRPLTSLGYAEAAAVLAGILTEAEAIQKVQQGHRNYAKRQMTWFRREPAVHWLSGTGDDPKIQHQAAELIRQYMQQKD